MNPLARLLAGLLPIALLTESYLERRDHRRYPPTGHLIDVDGHRLHVRVTGEERNGPTVILDAGMVSFSSNWAWVQPEVAKVAWVVAYDRAGLGWSEPRPGPQDAGTNAAVLHAALETLGITGPYVLAGHSYGGLAMRAFAVRYADEIAGMVLVDASHPDQWQRFGISSRVLGRASRISSLVARLGVFRVFSDEYRLLADGLPEQAFGELMAYARTPMALRTSGQTAMAWDDVTRPLVNGGGGLGDKPLIVLSVTEQPRKGRELTELQAELPSLSTDSRHLTIEGAYHEGLLSCREHALLVARSILEVVAVIRAEARLTAVGAVAGAGVAAQTADASPG